MSEKLIWKIWDINFRVIGENKNEWENNGRLYLFELFKHRKNEGNIKGCQTALPVMIFS